MKPEIDTLLQEKYPEYKDMLEDERDDFWGDLDDKEKYNINKEYLKLIANPNYDYLMCWEPGRFDTDEQATDYDNFYTIDYNWWLYQKESSWNSIGDYKKWMEQGSNTWTPEVVAKSINDFNERYKSYEISLSGDWYRLIDNDVFLYAQLISSKWYIFYQLETYLDDLQEQHIPYTFKDDDFTSLLNEDDPEKIYNANGREKELDAFKDKMRKFINVDLILQIDKILNKYKKVLSGKTFRIDNGYDDESFDPFTDFIFFDTASLKNVNPQKFLKTFKDHQVDTIELTRIIDELKSMIYLDFERIYNGNYKRFN